MYSTSTFCVAFLKTGGTVLEVKQGLPEALQPDETDAPESDGLSGGAIAAIVIVIIVVIVLATLIIVGVLVWMKRRQNKFELTTAESSYKTVEGTYQTDNFGKGNRGTFPMKPGPNIYTPVTGTDTTVTNTGAMSEEGEGAMREEVEGDNAPEKDVLGESSKDTHL